MRTINFKPAMFLALLIASNACLAGSAQPALKEAFSGKFLVGAAMNRGQILGEEPAVSSAPPSGNPTPSPGARGTRTGSR